MTASVTFCPRCLPPGLREHLLHQVFGVPFVIHDSKYEGIHAARITVVEPGRGVAVAGRQPAEAVAVFGLGLGGIAPKPGHRGEEPIMKVYAARMKTDGYQRA